MKTYFFICILFAMMTTSCTSHQTISKSNTQSFSTLTVLKKDKSILNADNGELKDSLLIVNHESSQLGPKTDSIHVNDILHIEEKSSLSEEFGLLGGLVGLSPMFVIQSNEGGAVGLVIIFAALMAGGGAIVGLIFPDNVIYTFE